MPLLGPRNINRYDPPDDGLPIRSSPTVTTGGLSASPPWRVDLHALYGSPMILLRVRSAAQTRLTDLVRRHDPHQGNYLERPKWQKLTVRNKLIT